MTALARVVYGDAPVELDDPAETYHEASKIYPSFAGCQAPGVRLLETDSEVRGVVARGVKRSVHLPAVRLPEPRLPAVPLAEALAARRSRAPFGARPLPFGSIACLLAAAYGVTKEGEQPLRAVPSGGALYPLELNVVAARVDGLDPGLYHYDPLRHVLERQRSGELRERLARTMVYPELAERSPAVVLVSAVFWRTRFKYGQRGYRFTLLEAGHAMQNLLLASAALGLAAVPIGGFFDSLLDELLGLDGVDESVLYAAAIGWPEEDS